MELALTLPVIVMRILGIMELGRAFMVYNEVPSAVREGARYGVAHPSQTEQELEDIKAAAWAKVTMLPAAHVPITVTYDTEPAFGHRVVVTATDDLDLLTPLIADSIGSMHIEMVSRRMILGGQ